MVLLSCFGFVRTRTKLKFVDLRGEDEVAFRQSIDLMSPDRDLSVSPAKTNVGMMSLLFGEISDAVYKFLRLAKV
jgi:hypothetical protein